jgi:hypothetical protein
MSFFDNLSKAASDLFGSITPQQASQAAGDHVQDMEPNELANHLQQSVGTMDTSSLAALGQQLLSTFTSHASYSGDGAQAAQEAGTSAEVVAQGSPQAVAAVIDYAKSNPQVLQEAASAFMQRNPEALQQLAPQLLQGIMGRIRGGDAPSAPPADQQ